MENRPCWLESAGMPRVRALDRNLVVDVVVMARASCPTAGSFLVRLKRDLEKIQPQEPVANK
jgi:hypothetical protein